MAMVKRLEGSISEALQLYEQSLSLYEEIPDLDGSARVRANIGILCFSRGEYDRAYEASKGALDHFETINNLEGILYATTNLANLCTVTGDFPGAFKYLQTLHDRNLEVGNRLQVARAIAGMANCYNAMSDYPTALEQFERALAIAEELGEQSVIAHIIGDIGNIYHNVGEYPRALEHFNRARAFYEESGDRSSVAHYICYSGNVLRQQGEYVRAQEHYERSLAMYQELDDPSWVACVIAYLCGIALDLQDYPRAESLLQQTPDTTKYGPITRLEHLINCGRLAEHYEDLDAALQHYSTALQVAESAGIRDRAATMHEGLRNLALKRNNLQDYVTHNDAFQRITEETRGRQATQRLAMLDAERKMQAERMEREKERALLYGALPQEIADRMVRGEVVNADQFDQAAVLFLDVVNFTTNSSEMDPADVVRLLESLFSNFDELCQRHGVMKVKTIGDSYMAFKGDESPAANATSVANLALAMRDTAFTWPSGEPLTYRVGLHLGPATAGVIGTQRLQYDVWGDTVNVASRMESNALPGTINVSGDVARVLQAEGRFQLESRGLIDVKGKGAMEMFVLQHG